MYCTNCGAQNPDGASFCTNCGKSFSTQTAPAQAPVVVAPISPETELMRKKATTAMVLGIIACVIAWYPVASIAAIVLGALAISKAGKVTAYFESIAQPRPGMALAGKIMGIISLVGGILMTLIYLAYFALVAVVLCNYAGEFPLHFEGLDIDLPVLSSF